MQSVSSQFDAAQAAAVRKISWSVLISFEKNFDAAIDFFTIGSSDIGGTDIIKGPGSVVQDWDQYDYTDYSDRVLAIEWDRETEPPTNPYSLANADVVLNNYDDLFTPGNSNSSLDGFLLPKRPIKIAAGFGSELVTVFVGLTDGKPIIDERTKTARLKCSDFLTSIFNVELDEAVIYENQLTSYIISELLQDHGGLTSSQISLDTGTVRIPFCYFQKGTKLSKAISEVALAELGNVFMDETGIIRMHNRTNWNSGSNQFTFDKDEVIERMNAGTNTVINVVEVFSNARAVEANQQIWELQAPVEIPAGETVDIFASFKDEFGELPVTAVDTPLYTDSATTSEYETNKLIDGSGPTLSSDISLGSPSLLSTSYKMPFTNSGSQSVWITAIKLFGTPARVVDEIYVRAEDATSTNNENFNEQPITIKNNYIQDETAANTLAQIIIADRANDDDQQELIVRAVPQLQIGDLVTYTDENQNETFFVTGINGIIDKSGFRQKLMVSKRTIEEYFQIEVSTIGGSDKLGP